mgnify:FL=1|jgi:hypothetical protein
MYMMTNDDIIRLVGDQTKIEKLINNAATACKNSTTEWSKNFWYNTFKTLCNKYSRTDLYNKLLH